jgi:hypothetical protein
MILLTRTTQRYSRQSQITPPHLLVLERWFCGVGEWDPIYLGKADYLQGGVERDWSFRDVLLAGGEVIHVCPPLTEWG